MIAVSDRILSMRIERIHHSREWDRFVMGRPDACYTHLYGWRNVMAAAYGHPSLYLAALDREQGIRAVLPLVRFRRLPGPDEWISIPYFDRAGFLARDPDAQRYLLSHAGVPTFERRLGAETPSERKN